MAALAGGFGSRVLLQVAVWPIRPQHPLRAAVADSWLAAANLFAAISPEEGTSQEARQAKMAERETSLRSTLDKAYEVLSAAAATRSSVLVSRLEQLNFAGARLAMRVGAFNSAQEVLMTEPGFDRLAPSFLPILTALNNTARSVALAVVSRQPGHLAAVEVRLQRLTNLLRPQRARLDAQTDVGRLEWANSATSCVKSRSIFPPSARPSGPPSNGPTNGPRFRSNCSISKP